MARSVAPVVATILILACLLIAMPRTAVASSALNCKQVVQHLKLCIPYAKSTGGAVPTGCCNGIRELHGIVKSTQDRQTACTCLETTAKSTTGLKLDVFAGIPKNCGVNIPYAISPSIDCSKVK